MLPIGGVAVQVLRLPQRNTKPVDERSKRSVVLTGVREPNPSQSKGQQRMIQRDPCRFLRIVGSRSSLNEKVKIVRVVRAVNLSVQTLLPLR